MDLINDSDPGETQEWRDALASVLAFEGPQRAGHIISELIAETQLHGVPVPFSATTISARPTLSG